MAEEVWTDPRFHGSHYFCSNFLFYLQQHFIIAATFKAITASIFIMKQVLFLKKLIKLAATFKFAAIIKN